ncbi:MAG: FUSC family protein [Gallionella sp.]
MPFAAALSSGLPLLIGAYFNHLEFGLVSSLGGMVFLYLPSTPLHHRMVTIMACAFAMSACYAFGVMAHFIPVFLVPMIVFTTVLVTMLCRFYGLGPPGSLFFIMAASIGAYSPVEFAAVPQHVGLLTLGCLLACLIAFFYSVYTLRLRPPEPIPALSPQTFDFIIFDSLIIGAFVGISLALAQALQMKNAYWVPVSCLAVIQGQTLRAVWNKHLQRILGTGIGLLVTWGLISLPLEKWSISLIMMMLAFVIEMAVVRHYGFAAIFITPLTILLAEASALGNGSSSLLIQARFFDTLLGSLAGFTGAICIHSPRFRDIAGRAIRRFVPARLLH